MLSLYPTSSLLLEAVSSVFSFADVRLLPDSSVPPNIVALRIVEMAKYTGQDLSPLLKPSRRSDSMHTPFIASHRSFFDQACVELERTNSVRCSLMGPTFLLPDEVFNKRICRKPGRSFARELKTAAERLTTLRVIVRNDRERFRSTYLPYIGRDGELELVHSMLEVASRIRCGEMLTRLEFRCVDIGYANPPHLFEQVALIGSRPRPDESVDGGWVITDKTSMATEEAKFDRVFLSYDRNESWDNLGTFLAGLL